MNKLQLPFLFMIIDRKLRIVTLGNPEIKRGIFNVKF